MSLFRKDQRRTYLRRRPFRYLDERPRDRMIVTPFGREGTKGMAHEYLQKEYALCFEQLRFYDERHESILTYTFNLTAAAATAVFAIYKLLNGATAVFFKFAATLSGLVFIATLLLFMALLQNRLYFVSVARQLNAIRGYLMEVEAKGFRDNQMYTSFDFPALKPFSVHTFTLIGAALISSLFAGGCAYAISPALGHARCLTIGVVTVLVVLVAEATGGFRYLLISGKKSADQAIHRASHAGKN